MVSETDHDDEAYELTWVRTLVFLWQGTGDVLKDQNHMTSSSKPATKLTILSTIAQIYWYAQRYCYNACGDSKSICIHPYRTNFKYDGTNIADS